MRVAIAALGVAAFAYVLCCQNAGAVAIGGAAIKSAADAGLPAAQPVFYGRTHRNYVVKCYRQLVVGPYVCRRYYRF
jgi:hypothetical protein